MAAVGAAWLAYQVQSLVDIDKPALVVVHWCLAGAIVVLARPEPERTSPRRPPPGPGSRRRRQQPVLSHMRARQLGVGAACLVGLVSLVQVVRPFAADRLATSGVDAAVRGDVQGGLDSLDTAQSLAPWSPQILFLRSQVQVQSGATGPALVDAQRAARLAPGDPAFFTLLSAQTAQQAGDDATAERWYLRAVQVDPFGRDVLGRATGFYARRGDEREAHRFVRRLLWVTRTQAPVWVLVGDVEAALGDEVRASAAYERALALDPRSADAQQGLERLRR